METEAEVSSQGSLKPGPGLTEGGRDVRGTQKGRGDVPHPSLQAHRGPRAGLLVYRPVPHPGVWPHCGWTLEGRRPEACDSGCSQSPYPCVTLGHFLGGASVSLLVE